MRRLAGLYVCVLLVLVAGCGPKVDPNATAFAMGSSDPIATPPPISMRVTRPDAAVSVARREKIDCEVEIVISDASRLPPSLLLVFRQGKRDDSSFELVPAKLGAGVYIFRARVKAPSKPGTFQLCPLAIYHAPSDPFPPGKGQSGAAHFVYGPGPIVQVRS